jgi:broad specificity phosphatase PhoE
VSTTRILLVRHALTDAVGQRLLGRGPCPGLNETGTAQAAALGAQLAGERPAAVICSPALRTRQTAEQLAAHHSLQVIEHDAFAEVDFGEWTGRSFAELEGDATWTAYNTVRSVTRAPGGELMLEVQARAVAGLLEARARYDGSTIVVVSHADVIRAMIGQVMGVPIDNLLRLAVEPASVSTVVFRGGWPQLTGLNRTS